MSVSIWVVDDDRSIRWVLEKALGQEGYAVTCFEDADEALNTLEQGGQEPEVLISDVRMPGTDGLRMLKILQRKNPDLPVIIMTAHSDLDSAVASYQGGAFEYLPKPFDVDEAVALVRRAIKHREESRGDFPEPVEEAPTEIIGEAPAMQEVFRAIGRLSHSNVTVLINGQSGTGKELVARALHRHSMRREKNFVALNMAAIPKDLIESELFGHEREPSPAPIISAWAVLSRPMAAPCFWMKSATCHWKPRPVCCGYFRKVNSIAWVGPRRFTWTCALLPPPTRIWKSW